MSQAINEHDLLKLLETGNSSEVIKTLQFLLKNKDLSQKSLVFIKIEELSKTGDIGTRFWAKKILNELGSYESTKISNSKSANSLGLNISKDLPLEILIQKLQSVTSTFLSLDIIKKLCESKRPEALSFLNTYLSSCQDVVQLSYLVKNIGIFYPTESSLKTLIPFLKHDDDRVVANAIEGIEAIKSNSCVVVLSQMLDHSSNRVRSNAAKALASYDPDQAFLVIKKMLDSVAGAHFKISAIHAIKALKNAKFLILLEPLLFDDITFPFSLAAIEEIGGKESLDCLTRNYAKFSEEKKEFVDEVAEKLSKQLKNPKAPSNKKIDPSQIFSKIDNFTNDFIHKMKVSNKSSEDPTDRSRVDESVLSATVKSSIETLKPVSKFAVAGLALVFCLVLLFFAGRFFIDPLSSSSISWSDFDQLFISGTTSSDLQKEEGWKRLKGSKIVWKGEVVDVKTDHSGDLEMLVKMKESTFTFDVCLKLNSDQKTKAEQISKGKMVVFSGNLNTLGGAIIPTEIVNGQIID